MPGDPFQIDVLPDTPIARAAIAAARPFLEWTLALGACRTIYQQLQSGAGEPFDARALRALDITPRAGVTELERIPRTGPLIVAANHPHGILDGLVLTSVLRRVRPDVRVLTNHVLSRIPELGEFCLFVDPFDGPHAAARSRAGLRAAHLWLRRGGALIVFPAGEVAHVRQRDGLHAASLGNPAPGLLPPATGARVVPAFIQGGNSLSFYAAGRVHPALRTMMLGRELLKKRGAAVAVHFGAVIAPADLVDDGLGATARVRAAVDQLAATVGREPDTSRERMVAGSVASGFHRTDPIAADVCALPSQALLVESGSFQVFWARAAQIPTALREIGRLRELTYRAIGEGTGRTCDLDRFDEQYLHLFSWDRDQRRIVGAYRVGQTDRIVATHGVDGLYTRTLFRYDEQLIERLAAPALELGRSFVRAEYQKNYNALLLLWKGIGRFIARHPQYRLLFGPVSISTRYSDFSHYLLMSFLQQNHFAAEFGELVDALHPPRVLVAPPSSALIPQSIDEINRLIERTEADGKGMPVLLRQYLKLNARLIGFNVDAAFGDAVDALMVVDLATIDRATLNRYLGRGEAEQFLARHGAIRRTSAAA
jgi:putative hemolysin